LEIPPFDRLPSGLPRRASVCLSLRAKDRVVTVRLRSLSLSKVEGSEVEPPKAELGLFFLKESRVVAG